MAKYNPALHHRRSIRLKGYDYSKKGLYFITICVRNRLHLFGHIENSEMHLNDAGLMIGNEWLALCDRYPNIALHEWVIMPNHFHAILEILDGTDDTALSDAALGDTDDTALGDTELSDHKGTPLPKNPTLGQMLGAFKSITTVEYIRNVNTHTWQQFDNKLWQRNYWEHIIRNNEENERIAEYIVNNPKKWDEDTLRH
jgi:putative transposase